MSRLALRRIPGGLVLGLLASLAAHAALYGGQHAVGGVYHALLLQVATVAALGFVAVVVGLAWAGSATSRSGDAIAARLCERLPGVGEVVASAAAWYAAVESVEPHHAGAAWTAMLLALAAASYAVLRVARIITTTVARATAALTRISFSPRQPVWRRLERLRPIVRRPLLAYRLFARPPPVTIALSRA